MQAIALQYSPVWQQKIASRRIVESLLEAAEPEAGAFVVLPEMAETGWSLEPEKVIPGDTLEWAADVAIRHRIHLQVGFPRQVERAPGASNAVAIVHPDGSSGPIYEKVHPFGFTPEADHFAAGENLVVDKVREYEVAPSICYDLRFPELHRLAVAGGAQLLAIGANWPRERAMHWRTLVIARAIENQAFVIATNRTGDDPSFCYQGGSLIVGPDGTVLAEGGAEAEAVSAPLDLNLLLDWRAKFPALADRRDRLLGSFPVVRPPDHVPGRDKAHD